jgi:hypothetical protein
MRLWRPAALAAIVAAAGLGVVARRQAAGAHPPIVSVDLEHLSLTRGDQIGAFILEAIEKRGGWSLRLRAAHCDGPFYMTAFPISEAPAEDFIKLRYPAAEWRAFYVYRRQTYDTFARLPAQLGSLARRAVTAITFAPRDPAELRFFAFHTPVGCAIAPNAAIDAADAVTALSRLQEP